MVVILSKIRFALLAFNVSSVYIALGLLLSLQPPFYPSEAEKKGAKPAEYGFVFGIANLSLFLFSPIFGKYGAKIGAKLCFNVGAVMQGVSGFCFAFLCYANNAIVFLALSYLLRFLEGMGTAMAWSAALGILMKIFPNKVAKVMSWTQTCFGLGYMLGPAVGAALYEAGGFLLPFVVVGALSTILSLLLVVTIPTLEEVPDESNRSTSTNSNGTIAGNQNGTVPKSSLSNGNLSEEDPLLSSPPPERPPLNFLSLFKSLTLLLPFVDLFAALCGNGMLESMLEPHLRDANADTIDIGVTFLLFGCTYMLGNMFFGCIMDRVGYPIGFSMLGNIFFLIVFLFIGPVTFLPVKTSKVLIQCMMVLAGLAYSVSVVASFCRAQKRVLEMGYADDLHTYVMISGIWMSSFALGNFAGPTVGGIVVQTAGFPRTTLIFFILYCVMLSIDILLAFRESSCRRNNLRSTYEQIN